MNDKTPNDNQQTTMNDGKRKVDVLNDSANSETLEKNKISEKKILVSEGSDEGFIHKGRIIADRFKIEGIIGAGGQCTVLKARDLDTTEKVAVKHLNQLPSGSDRDLIFQRFKNEAKAIGNLKHGDIIQMKTTCKDEILGPVIILEYVDGKNLGELVKEKVLEPKLAAKLFIRIGKALAHAHNRSSTKTDGEEIRDIIHRDLKPSNILIGNEEKFYKDPSDSDVLVKIADFGLGKFIGDYRTKGSKGATGTTGIVGTPNYMSPEQMREEEATKSSDIYSLGATLYETLTGRPPFTAQNYGHLYKQVMESDPTPPRVIDPNIPAQLDAICLKCLEKKPGNRYGRVEDFVGDLEKFLADNPNTIAKVPSGLERTIKVIRKNPVLVSTALGLAFLTFSFLLIINYFINQQKETELLVFQNKIMTDQKEYEKKQKDLHAKNSETLKKTLKELITSVSKIRDSVEKIGYNDETKSLFFSLQEYYTNLGDLPLDNEAILEKVQIAAANLSLAEIIEKIGTPEKSIEVYTKTIEVYEKTNKQLDKSNYTIENQQNLVYLAKAMGKKANFLNDMRKFTEARKLLKDAFGIINELAESNEKKSSELQGKIPAEIRDLSAEISKIKGLLLHYQASVERNDDDTANKENNPKNALVRKKERVLENYDQSIEEFKKSLTAKPTGETKWFLARAYGFRGDIHLKDRESFIKAEKDYYDSHWQRIEYLKSLLANNNEVMKNDFFIDFKQIKWDTIQEKRLIKEALLQLNRSFGNFADLNYNQKYLNSAIYYTDLQMNLIFDLYNANKNDYECLGDCLYALNKSIFLRICKYYDEKTSQQSEEIVRVKKEISVLIEKLAILYDEQKIDQKIETSYKEQSGSFVTSWIYTKLLIGEARLRILSEGQTSTAIKLFKTATDFYERESSANKAAFDKKLDKLGHFNLARIYGFLAQEQNDPGQKEVLFKAAKDQLDLATKEKFIFDYDTFYLKTLPKGDPAFEGSSLSQAVN